MVENENRRKFLKESIMVSAGIAAGLSIEEKILLAKLKESHTVPAQKETSNKRLTMGQIGKFKMSRLICGDNLITGFAHSRDLMYVSSLLRHYFTDEKIMETLKICEENGINTIMALVEDSTIKILKRFRKENSGKIQWLAKNRVMGSDFKSDIKKAVDNGAIGAVIDGAFCDQSYGNGRIEFLGKIVSFIQGNGLIAGVGAHLLEVIKAVEKLGIEPDFYFKTLNKIGYQCAEHQKTVEYMKNIKKPWIAFKVLGAGVVHPYLGFAPAFKSGADFITVGMFDFQVEEDAKIVNEIFSKNLKRERPWCG